MFICLLLYKWVNFWTFIYLILFILTVWVYLPTQMLLQCVYAKSLERRLSNHYKIPSYRVSSRTVQNQKPTHGCLEINFIREYNWCYFSSLKFLQE